MMIDIFITLACYMALIFSAVGLTWGIYLGYLEWLTYRLARDRSSTRIQALRRAARYAEDTPYIEL